LVHQYSPRSRNWFFKWDAGPPANARAPRDAWQACWQVITDLLDFLPPPLYLILAGDARKKAGPAACFF